MTTNTGQLDLTHWIYRVIAYIIDSIIIGIPAAIIYYIVILALITPSYTVLGVTVYGVAPWWSFLLLPFLLGIIQLFYFMFLDSAWGGTIGKRVMGLQVQTVNGNKVPFDKSFIRNISKIYGLFLFLDWLVAVITPGNDKRQKFTDRFAGTTVIQTRQAFAGASSSPPPPPPPPPTS
jgi:uncharacterized RDD family membrane protein YckC